MATIWVTEADKTTRDAQGSPIPALNLPSVTSQKLSITGTSTQLSTAFQKKTRIIRVIADADCHIAVGANPTADTDSIPLEANVSEIFGVQEELVTGHTLAVIERV